MKAFGAAAWHRQQATINNRYNLLTLWWEEAAECGGGTSNTTFVDIYEQSYGSFRKWGGSFEESVGFLLLSENTDIT
jgi:hypothetical protein